MGAEQVRMGRTEPDVRLGGVPALQATYTDFRWDIEVAQSRGDMGYTVGYERFNHHAEDGSIEPITVRVTHVYRREDGEWTIVHRHGDLAPVDESPPQDGTAE
jgi:ketosteroid isomerase-like protein